MKHDAGKLIFATALLSAVVAGGAGAQSARSANASQERDRKAEEGTTKTFPPDQVVVKVSGKQATVGDVEFASHFLPREIQGEMATEGRAALGEQYARLVTLTEEAERQHLDDSPDFRRRMEMARMQWLSVAEYMKLDDGIQVTDAEIKKDYDAHRRDYAEILVREVSIRKKSGEGPGASLQEARAKAAEIRKAIESGVDFSKVAAQFQKPGEIYFDPTLRPIRRGQLAKRAESKLFALKDGALSDVTEELQVLSFVQVVKHTEASLQDEEQAIRVKLHNQRMNEAIGRLEKQAHVWLDPVYFAPLDPGEEREHKAGESGPHSP